MMAKKTVVLTTLGAFILALSVFAGNFVERPHKAFGQFHVVVDLSDSSYIATGEGNGTHTGLFHSRLEGYVTWVDGVPVPSSGSGTITAANNDQLIAKVESDGSTTIVDGTGRFNGASGHQTATIVGTPRVAFPEPGIMTIDVTQALEGTLTY